MKKNNQRGYLLAETLIVATFIAGVLLFIYIQLRNINQSYKTNFSYNTATALAAAENIREFILQDGYDSVKTYLNGTNAVNYVDISTCPGTVTTEMVYCNKLMETLKIKTAVLTTEDGSGLVSTLDTNTTFSDSFKKFVKRQKVDNNPGIYRLYIETNDKEFASIKVYDPKTDVVINPKKLISELIKQEGTSTTTTEGFIDNGDGTYQYTGASGTGGTNWLWYGGHLWRIMTVNTKDNTMELVTSYPVTGIQWGDTVANKSSLETSYVGKWLNEVFLTSLPTNVQNSLVPMTYTKKVYNGSSVVSEEVGNVKVRLLTETEYTNYSGQNKYLDIKDNYWLADIYNASDVRHVNHNGSLSHISTIYSYGVRPAVKVSGITFTEGEGTLTSPYVASTSNARKTIDIAVGEYVNIPASDGSTYLTRVVSQTGGTKVVLNGLYTTSTFGDTTIFSKTSTIYTGALTTFKGALDTIYFDNSDKSYNITRYDDGTDYSLVTSTVASDMGLLSVGEMFSGNDLDLLQSTTKTFVDSSKILNSSLNGYSWVMNSKSDTYVRFVNNAGNISYGNYTSAFGVRPTWYLKDGPVTGGSGTANDPYLLK